VPGQLDPPPNADGTLSAEQAGIDRLHFDTSAGSGHAPVFGVLPTIYPLALGETPILQPLASVFPVTGNHSPGARVWFNAMRYLADYNGGNSLHSSPGLFSADDLLPTLFPASTLVPSTSITVTMVDALSPQFGHVAAVHHETGQGALLAHAATLPAPPSTGPPGGLANPNPAFAAALTAAFSPLVASLGKSTASATTQIEREHQQDQHAVEARYQLGWGHVVAVIDSVDGSVTETVAFPKLSDALLAVLTPSKASKAEASYQESTTNHLWSKARSTSYFDGMTDWDTKSLGIPGISCIREFRFATEPPTLDPDELKDRLSILHFACTDPGSVAYKTRQEEGRLLTRQYLVREDKSKLKRKITDLYYRGQIATADNLKTAIANFWTFSSWAFVDFVTSPPSIWAALEELVFLLNSPAGRV
jgi:hypothetical protein